MDAAHRRLVTALEGLHPGTFVILEYEKETPWDPRPYAQCAREVEGWYCDVVSQSYLPRESWPIDELALRRAGWLLPDDETANWRQGAVSARIAAERLVQGLRAGRLCPDPEAFSCRGGTFPSGPDGGEPVPPPDYSSMLQAA